VCDVHRVGPADTTAARLTARLRASIGAAVAARDHEVSWPIAQAAFAAHTRLALPAATPQVARLGIDEIRHDKARFQLVRGEAGGKGWEVVADTWHVGMVDLGGGAGLLGQVEGRTAAAVSAWIEAQSPTWRAAVQVVAIDMCTVFKSAIRTSLSHARLVVDRFHADRGAPPRHRPAARTPGTQGQPGVGAEKQAHTRRRTDAREASGPDNRRPPEPASENRRTDPQGLERQGRPDGPARVHGTHPDRTQIMALLIRFYENAAACGLPEMQRLAGTVSAWWPQILAAITTGVTNAGSEGTNRVIKTDARCAFGYRPASQRLRARAATTSRARGHLTNPHQRTPRPTQTPPRNRTARSSS
jgi:transposase